MIAGMFFCKVWSVINNTSHACLVNVPRHLCVCLRSSHFGISAILLLQQFSTVPRNRCCSTEASDVWQALCGSQFSVLAKQICPMVPKLNPFSGPRAGVSAVKTRSTVSQPGTGYKPTLETPWWKMCAYTVCGNTSVFPFVQFTVCLCASVAACMRVQKSQLQSEVKVSFFLILDLFPSRSTHNLSSPLDMDRLSQVALSDCYHWLHHSPNPTTTTHFPTPVCLSPSLTSFLPSSPPPLLSLTFFSIWLCSHVA